jgi:hypothetical protein
MGGAMGGGITGGKDGGGGGEVIREDTGAIGVEGFTTVGACACACGSEAFTVVVVSGAAETGVAGVGFFIMTAGAGALDGSITLGLATASPAPTIAAFVSPSWGTSSGLRVLQLYVDTLGGAYMSTTQAITTPRKRLERDWAIFIDRCQYLFFPFHFLLVCRTRRGNIRVCTSYPLRPYMSPPLNRHSIKYLATHDTREGRSETSPMQISTDNKVPILSVYPPGKARRVDALATRFKNQFTNQIAFGTSLTRVVCHVSAVHYTCNLWIHGC